jgi:hypothetical protein
MKQNKANKTELTVVEEQLISKKTLEMLRAAANEKVTPAGKLSCLSKFSDRQLIEVYLRLRKGYDLDHIIRIIQKDWGFYSTIKATKVMKHLVNFRDTVLTSVQKEIIQEISQGDKSVTKRTHRTLESLDGLGALRWLITEQMERVQLYRECETVAGMPMTATDTSVKELGVLLDKYLDIEMKLGLLEPTPSKMEQDINKKFQGLVLGNLQNDGRSIIEAASKFLDYAERETLTIEADTEGKYSVVKVGKDSGT